MVFLNAETKNTLDNSNMDQTEEIAKLFFLHKIEYTENIKRITTNMALM